MANTVNIPRLFDLHFGMAPSVSYPSNHDMEEALTFF